MKRMEIFFRRLLINILLSFRFAPKPLEEDYKAGNSKILFIRLNRIGDALVITPLLHEMRKQTSSKIYLLADKKNYFVFENNNDIDDVIIFERGIKGIFRVLNFIKENKINTIVDLHDDVSTTVSFLIAFAKASNKFGLKKVNNKIYSATAPRLDPKIFHVVERIMEIGKLFHLQFSKEDININYRPRLESEKNVQCFLNESNLNDKFLVGINISAGSHARFWGIDNYKKLLNLFSSMNLNFVLLTSPADLKLAKEISKINIFYSESFDEFAAAISKLDFLFTPDTAAVHLASAFKIPMFGLYVKYKTNDMIWSPYCSQFEYVITEEPNLDNVRFEDVKNKLEPFIKNILLQNVHH